MLNKKHLLLLVVAFQFFILTGVYAKAQLPLWTGLEVRVKTIPRDPRSLFRGNYARLNYAFSSIPRIHLGSESAIRIGEIVYISLQKNADMLYEYASASLVKPRDGVFIRGRVTSVRSDKVHIHYGIDAYFAPKQEALRLEKQLRSGALAVLMVTSAGQAGLKEIVSP